MATPIVTTLPFGQSTLLPSGVLVTFPIQYCDNTPIPANNPPVYTQTVEITSLFPAPPPTGSPGVKIFHETCPALMATSADSTPLNVADLTALANQIATDFYSWSGTSFNYVFNGVQLWNTQAFADEIIVHYERDQIRTTVLTAPWTGYAEELQHTDNPQCSTSSSGSQSSSASSGSQSISMSSVSQSNSSSSQSASPSQSPSQSNCPPNNGLYSLVSDIICNNGVLSIFKTVFQYVNGVLTCVTGPFYDGDAGCCDCPGVSASASVSQSNSNASTSSCACPCIGNLASRCFNLDISVLLGGLCKFFPPGTGKFDLAAYDICKWKGHDYGGAYPVDISYSCSGWIMTIGTFGQTCYWTATGSPFNCCLGGDFTIVSGPVGVGVLIHVSPGSLSGPSTACPGGCQVLWS